MSQPSLTYLVQKSFSQISPDGNSPGINLLRHSYTTWLYNNHPDQPYSFYKKFADIMAHTVETQRTYMVIIDKN